LVRPETVLRWHRKGRPVGRQKSIRVRQLVRSVVQLVEHISASQLVILERSGHYQFIEEPETFWTAVARFVAAQTAPEPVS
jgi:pimeloyl-ACP methyl ester carboxylesterase